ncbi:hypothetical protein [Blastococcus mobilis]|uniref:protein-tyrosine-phosphatase n=1 Tax=Blastococcus mobilis TaxID=1938746 RepID=A0A238W4Z3_9ACTN|nr:hypothetical protein [Blastococcus mobilis]SNR41471.1 protein-tyrosine phosphatase [Blastococcus mobilis]
MTTPQAPAEDERWSVLTVCTGNVCRSPAMEYLLRAALGPGAGVEVRSAGTRALVGRPVEPPMARLLTAAGADPTGFAARGLTPADVARADLVLTAEKAHRSAVVALQPRALRRTFTLLEFVDLVVLARAAAGHDWPTQGVPERLVWLVARAPALRPQRPWPAEDDVPDPYGRDDACFAATAGRVGAAVATLRAVLLDS